ncbi:MAG: 16S rRNA (uracil(1498)-N(3))-methyltransferase [Nitrospirae bacterium]|nr:16S rRNA (uracil(1498)-N(3))-methyltransferase [Nitrospirota bacterium]
MTIFIDPEIIADKRHVKVPLEKARYLLTVLRCRKGDMLTVIDGKGGAYVSHIVSIAGKDVFIDIAGELPLNTELHVELILYQGLLKGEKMDMVIQKATELGVSEIVPVVTERSIVRETGKLKRWRKIAEEAAEQCGRAVIPAVRVPQEINKVFDGNKINGLLFWEKGGIGLSEAMATIDTGKAVTILIGPEGGFTADEVREAEEHGIVRTTLGRRILRAETAAIAASALVQFFIEKADKPA